MRIAPDLCCFRQTLSVFPDTFAVHFRVVWLARKRFILFFLPGEEKKQAAEGVRGTKGKTP